MLYLLKILLELRLFFFKEFKVYRYKFFQNYIYIKFESYLNTFYFLYILNSLFVIFLFYVLFFFYSIFFIYFSYLIFIFFFIISFYLYNNYVINSNWFNNVVVNDFFIRHKYINDFCLFFYKWSHIYLWWLEFKLVILNVLRFSRYIFLKLGLNSYFKKLDLNFFFLINIFIEKFFYVLILKIFRNLKIKIISSNLKLLIINMLQVLSVLCLLFVLNISIIFLIKFYIILKMIEVLNYSLNELDYYYNRNYNKFDPMHFSADSLHSSPYIFQEFICDKIFFDRKFLNQLEFKKRRSFYQFNLLADQSLYLKVNYLTLGNSTYKSFDYCNLFIENMYWYDNDLYFKDIMGGLHLLYIMNFAYMLKELISKKVSFENYTWVGERLLGDDIYNKLVLKLENLLLLFKSFWILINKIEVNNGQIFKISLIKIFDEMLSYDITTVSIKLKVNVDNLNIKSIYNVDGNLQMLELYTKLLQGMQEWKLIEEKLIINKFLPINNTFDTDNWGLYQGINSVELSNYYFKAINYNLSIVIGSNYLEKEVKIFNG